MPGPLPSGYSLAERSFSAQHHPGTHQNDANGCAEPQQEWERQVNTGIRGIPRIFSRCDGAARIGPTVFDPVVHIAVCKDPVQMTAIVLEANLVDQVRHLRIGAASPWVAPGPCAA